MIGTSLGYALEGVIAEWVINSIKYSWRPVRDLNPCCRRERAVS